jgi:hypothetical protein
MAPIDLFDAGLPQAFNLYKKVIFAKRNKICIPVSEYNPLPIWVCLPRKQENECSYTIKTFRLCLIAVIISTNKELLLETLKEGDYF